jgi:hypothetical protein
LVVCQVKELVRIEVFIFLLLVLVFLLLFFILILVLIFVILLEILLHLGVEFALFVLRKVHQARYLIGLHLIVDRRERAA